MANYAVLDAEREREIEVRKVDCPICGTPPKAPCLWPPGVYPPTSHTGRYDRAASVGLVPKLPKLRPLSPDIAAVLLASLARPKDSLQMPKSRSAHG